MVRFVLVKGRKGPNDRLVKLYSNGEVLSFSDILFILDTYFRAEASYYPKEKGFQGSDMLLKAIQAIHSGVSVEEVCALYNLDYKTNITDLTEPRSPQRKASDKVADFM